MDHKWLDDFIALARERSFSRAATLRHVTQPQFSRRIRALELWAGADLVDRSGVPLGLTEAGEAFLPVARRAVAGLGDARARIRHAARGGDGQWLTLATGRTLSRTAVPDWLARVQRQVGPVRLRILTGSIHDGVTALEQGAADFLITFSHPRLPLLLDDESYEGRVIGGDELVAVSAPQARASTRPLHALPGTPRRPAAALAYAPTLALAQILEDGLVRRRGDLHLQTVIESDFAESLHEQALRGVGLAWLPRSLVAADLALGRLVAAAGRTAEAPIRFDVRLLRPRTARTALAERAWAASAD